MSDFSDLESTSDVGAQPEVQETKDVDAGDGDGVNDFDEAYNSEMNGQEQEFEYPENGDSGENTDNGEEYDTQQAVDNATSEFDESVDNDSNTDGTGMADGQAGQDAGVMQDDSESEELSTVDYADATCNDFESELEDDESPTETAESDDTLDDSDEVNTADSKMEKNSEDTVEVDDTDGEQTDNVDVTTEDTGETNTDVSDEENLSDDEAEDSTDTTGEVNDVDRETTDNEDAITEDADETSTDASVEANTEESEAEDSTDVTGEVNDVDRETTDNVDAITEDAVNEGTDSSDKVDDSSDGEATDGDNNAEKNAHYENASYSQGQNQYGYLGTCGPTSVSNSLNRVTGTDQYTENKVLTNAVDNNLCYKSDNPNSSGGTGTKEVVQLIDNVKSPESNIHTEVYEYDKALSVNELADRIKEPGTVAMVGVDSATLWDQRGDVSNSGLFQTSEYSDHWITVDSPTYEEDGNLTGFNVIDSGGGVDFVDKNKFESMYMGDANHSIKDPTALIISNEGDAVSKYSAPEGIEKTVNYKGSAMPSDGGDSPLKYSTEGKTNSEIEIINAEAADLGTENTWKEFCNDEQNQKIYDTLDEAKGGYEKLLGPEPSPWPDGYESEIKEIPVGTRFEMAMAPGQPDDRPGGFGTMSTIEDKEYVRDKLAVKEDWKPDIDRVNTYEIVKPMQANVGPVGPQVDIPADRYLHGGADQLEMRVNPRDRMEYIRLVESREVK